MKTSSFRHTMLKGAALALPLAVVLYVLVKIVRVLEKAITPLAKKIGFPNILGEITLTIVVILFLLLLVFFLGLLMQLAFIASFRIYLEDLIVKMVPSLNSLKLMAAEKLETENAANSWKPILLENDGQFSPAFIIEESDDWITLVLVKPPASEPESMLITRKNSINYKEITLKQMMRFNKEFGKGFLSLIQTTGKNS